MEFESEEVSDVFCAFGEVFSATSTCTTSQLFGFHEFVVLPG
jgi:hypothetical protein